MPFARNFSKTTLSNAVFWIGWILLSFQYGHFKRMGNPPESVHQSAQCDRASIALNYYQGGMHFSTPQVHESRTTGGYTGCEFPLMNYTAALLYKTFGFGEFWYRFVMWICVSAGIFCFYRTLLFFNPNIWVNLLLTFLLTASPVMQFYTPNFLPDAASLGFMLIAFFAFFSWHFNGFKIKYAIALIVFASLGSLVKITSLIGVFSMGALVVLTLFPILKFKKWEKSGWLIALLVIPAICTFLWYAYAGNFSKKHSSPYFLLDINPPSDFTELRDNLKMVWVHWWDSLFHKYFWYVFPALFFVVILFKTNRLMSTFFALLFSSSVVFMIAMLRQMRYHDYYFLPLWPVFLFAGLLIADSSKNWKQPIQLGAAVIGLFLFVKGYSHTCTLLKSRYEPGNFWYQSAFPNNFYKKATVFAKAHHITINNRVISAFDASPNNSLYFLNLKGYRISPDQPEEYGRYIDSTYHAEYLILNDTSFFTKHPVFRSKATFIDSAGKILFYRLRHNM